MTKEAGQGRAGMVYVGGWMGIYGYVQGGRSKQKKKYESGYFDRQNEKIEIEIGGLEIRGEKDGWFGHKASVTGKHGSRKEAK
ncbi:hypothetical protein MGYG_05205 [Nannizzia gypsea CBS 118893]|uniref:Uncharacterized protein n=1 Tax=Arthroderma gypseum (strain ATCC MYA-4604 / CBS 118893) TaxID=535722 RepID=E4UV75_ARTGP|nr:hypothetical protein MGYG_05205 [Nannizzia gypsea CBS 118893]EFR02202.1 hypothetical protein MGYG_05205 [Nannizzia gypsea CBS 118893]